MDRILILKMRLRLIAIMAAATSAAPWASTYAQTCPSNHTEIRIAGKITPPRIDLTKSQAQLTAMRFNDAVASDRRFVELTGLTVAGITVDQEMRFASSRPEDGPNCVWPSVVTVTLSTTPTIYVVSGHGQCLLTLGIEHEQRHVAVNQAIIANYSTIFRRRIAAMAQAIAEASAPPTRDADALRARMEEKINAMIAVTADKMYETWTSDQHAVDSPQEYRRISDACPQVSVEPGP